MFINYARIPRRPASPAVFAYAAREGSCPALFILLITGGIIRTGMPGYKIISKINNGVFTTHGLLVSLEGIDGCGKTTQVALLQARLEQNQIPFIAVREPGGTAVGEGIRQVLLQSSYSLTAEAELLLYMAARAELSRQVIIPALLKGRLVLCDRFTDSTLAYQGYGAGMDLQWIKQLNRKATAGRLPDLTFLLNLSAEAAAARRGNPPDRMEKKDLRYHRRVQRGYLEIARYEPERVAVLDAAIDAEALGDEIWHRLCKHLEKESQ